MRTSSKGSIPINIQPSTQIVFIHRGNTWYVPYALYQAKHASGDSEIVLLGDSCRFPGIAYEPLAGLSSEALRDFDAHYVHFCSNPERFEKFCWQRWFYLLEYMRRRKVESVLCLDSDVLLYSSLEELRNIYSDAVGDCGLIVLRHGPGAAVSLVSAGISFWTWSMLEAFCEFTVRSYVEQDRLARYRRMWEEYQLLNVPGGICDMTTVTLFWQEHQDRVVNLAASCRGNVFDANFNAGGNVLPDEYLTESGTKKVEFVDGRPFFLRGGEGGGRDRACALHFQGVSKPLMRRYYTGDRFPGKGYYDVLCGLNTIGGHLRRWLRR